MRSELGVVTGTRDRMAFLAGLLRAGQPNKVSHIKLEWPI